MTTWTTKTSYTMKSAAAAAATWKVSALTVHKIFARVASSATHRPARQRTAIALVHYLLQNLLHCNHSLIPLNCHACKDRQRNHCKDNQWHPVEATFLLASHCMTTEHPRLTSLATPRTGKQGTPAHHDSRKLKSLVWVIEGITRGSHFLCHHRLLHGLVGQSMSLPLMSWKGMDCQERFAV